MNDLKITGVQEFLGREIPVIEGGFGENQKVVLAKTVAEIHEVELKKINELINNNIDEFEDGIDILNLKSNGLYQVPFEKLGFSSRDITISKNIYLLSEQGYMALISLMRTEKAKELRKKFRREYFTMKQVINSDEQLKANLLLQIYNGGADGAIAARQLTDIEVKEATQPLLETITEKETIIDRVIPDEDIFGIDIIGKMLKPYSDRMGAKKIFDFMREQGILIDAKGTQRHNLPYDRYNTYFEMKRIDKETMFGHNSYTKTYFTGKGLKWFLSRLAKGSIITPKQQKDVLEQL